MNRRMVFYMLGQILKLEAALMSLPMAVALIYGEYTGVLAFAVAVCVALSLGLALTITMKSANQLIFAREGFLIVALAWVFLSAIGALPFVLSHEIPSYVDALFETVSGFTTTGASILDNPALLSHGMLFWRSFTHWIGGMGVLVMIVAILPTVSGRSIHILRAEMPGPVVGKLVPRIRKTAKILYFIYIGMTVAEIVFLLCGGMSLFDSMVHSFGTAGTGGFGIRASSIGEYSPYLQWVITVFMLLFGVNFNLYFLILIKRFRSVVKSGELWCYLGIFAVSAALITFNISSLYQTVGETVRHSAFQTASVLTTTGYSTANFDAWPELSKTLLFILMFIGGCAGSTAGGLKVSRVLILFKSIKRDLKKLIHPRSVSGVNYEGRPLSDDTQNNVSSYFALYIICFVFVFALLSFENFSFETNITATAACFNNVGPGFGAVGPTFSYSLYAPASKLLLSLAMLFGRLEIYPMMFMLYPASWKR